MGISEGWSKKLDEVPWPFDPKTTKKKKKTVGHYPVDFPTDIQAEIEKFWEGDGWRKPR